MNVEALHKKKVKTPNGVMNSVSKFGKWMPVKSCNGSFTPRSVLHRSLSDNSSAEKLKSSVNRREIKRQLSTQADYASQSGIFVFSIYLYTFQRSVILEKIYSKTM